MNKSKQRLLNIPIHNNVNAANANQFYLDESFVHPSISEHVFTDGNSHFQALLKDIKQAKTSIELETYIFQKDSIGKIIAQALSTAAKHGVKVRVMVDGAGTPFWGGAFTRALEKAGVQTRVFHPFPWQLWHWSRSKVKAPLLLKSIYLLLKINSRNHRKVCLIDKKTVFIGSFNISQCHLSNEAGGHNWRDTSIRLSGTYFEELSNAFESAWSHRPIKERVRDAFRHVKRHSVIRLNHTRHRRRILYKNLLRRMRLCQHRIWITNAYFVPDNFLLRKLKDAAKNGVDVRILLPKKSDVMMMPWTSSTFYYTLLKSGVRIFEYLPSMLHAKSLILDDWMLIGSSNLNHRSLLHDLEIDVNVSSAKSKHHLSQQFLQDLKHAKEIKLDDIKDLRPRYQRWFGRLLLYFKYWI